LKVATSRPLPVASARPVLFNSWIFLVFFAVVVGLYTALGTWSRAPVRTQNALLLVASYVFYGWWDWRFLLLLWVSTVVDYFVALRVDRASSQRSAKRWLWVSLITNLGVLGFFKYLGFFVDSTIDLLQFFGLGVHAPTLEIVLPVGISFYTFQTLSYTIDVYRKRMAPEPSLSVFALYVAFFPQLVAGPIERAGTLLPQLRTQRTLDYDQWCTGGVLIFLGLVRKVGIADRAAPVVNDIFARSYTAGSVELIAGVLLFALQIYGDFAGYSAIARGTARILGFELMENFHLPYLATNITEFWRRWHISLSTWLRDYLYIPLGGNRAGELRAYRNLMLTMLLGGLWHGAAWTFVIWGGLHGFALVLHKLWVRKVGAPRPIVRAAQIPGAVLGWVATMLTVLVAWVFFRAPTLHSATSILAQMWRWEGAYAFDLLALPYEWGPLELALALLAWTLIIDLPYARWGEQTAILRWPWPLRALTYAVFVLLLLVGEETADVPFIYFQF